MSGGCKQEQPAAGRPSMEGLGVTSRHQAGRLAALRRQRMHSCSMGLDVRQACWRNSDAGLATSLVLTLDKASQVGFFPHRKTWARCAPSLHDLRVAARLATEPFQQIKNERFNGIRHHRSSGGGGALRSLARSATAPLDGGGRPLVHVDRELRGGCVLGSPAMPCGA